MNQSGKEDFLDKAVQIYRPADCLCPAAPEQGTQVAEVTRKMGISEQTFYPWKKKFGGADALGGP